MKKTLVVAFLSICIITIFYTFRSGLDVQSHTYESFKDIKGGWLPVKPELLPTPKLIFLKNDLDTNDYFFKIVFSEEHFKKLETFIESKFKSKRTVQCEAQISFCIPDSMIDKVLVYELENNLDYGQDLSFWALNNKKHEVYVSNEDPPKASLIIK